MKKIFLAVFVVIIALVAIVLWQRDGADRMDGQTSDAPTEDPMDAVLAFYDPWLAAVQSTTTNPYAAGLATSSQLTTTVQEYIATQRDGEREPVLCQASVPDRIGTKLLYGQETSAQVQVLARGSATKSADFALVTLSADGGEWQISEIACRSGESAPERAFSFERQGHLLKSVPEPLNSDYWHLVFEENGQPGHTAPLFFSENSVCVSETGQETVCDESQFADATPATVYGELTESGVEVKRLEF